MAVEKRRVNLRTFFLNEIHELASAEKAGGGRLPAYSPIPWAAKAKRLNDSIQRVEQLIVGSNDPLKEDRFFVLANPVTEVEKMSNDKKKAADWDLHGENGIRRSPQPCLRPPGYGPSPGHG